MHKFLCLLLIFFTRICDCHEIHNISFEDKQKLEQFFEFLITRTCFGYTLCGNKPCSIQNIPVLSTIPLKYSVQIFFNCQGYSILAKGWEMCSKHISQFSSKNFVLRYNSAYNTLILINKKATRDIIQENLDLFHKYSKSKLSVEEYLQEICYPTNNNRDYLINYHIALLGILLGYGRNNALSFTQRSYIQNLKRFDLDDSYQPLNAILNPGFISIQNGTNEKENNRIKEILKEAKKNIKEQFKSSNYLETFIKILNDDAY